MKNTIITIQQPSANSGTGYDKAATVYSDYKTIFADKRTIYKNYYANGVHIEQDDAVFKVWYDSEIGIGDRIVCDSKDYKILDIAPDSRRVEMEIKARVWTA